MLVALPDTVRGWIRLFWQLATDPPPPEPFPAPRFVDASGKRPRGGAGSGSPYRSHAADSASFVGWGRQAAAELAAAQELALAAQKDAARFRELYIAETDRSDSLAADLKRERLVLDQQRVIIGNERQRADVAEQALKACVRANATLRGGN